MLIPEAALFPEACLFTGNVLLKNSIFGRGLYSPVSFAFVYGVLK